MPIRPLNNQARNLGLLVQQLARHERLLVGFDEGRSRPHGGRVLKRNTEPELTRCIRAAGNKPIVFYAISRDDVLPHHQL